MRPRPLVFVLMLLLAPALAPMAGAHGEEQHGGTEAETPGTTEPAPGDTPEPEGGLRGGYTGPGREPYVNFFEGTWLYGAASATPLGDQRPLHMRGDGDWIVWEDAARSDIYVHNIPAGSGFYLQADGAIQRNPDISGNVVVYEDYSNATGAAIRAYFLDTGETRLVSTDAGNHRNPSIRGHLIAWENDRDRNLDIYAYSLENATQFPIVVGPDRESDPLVLGDSVYYRAYRFNIWDVFRVDLERNETVQVTADVLIQGAPFTNGYDVFFLTQYFTAWRLDRYDPVADRVTRTPLSFQDTTPVSASSEQLLGSVRDLEYRQLVASNLTTGESSHVSGNLALWTEPWLDGRTGYAAVLTRNGTSLVSIDISPFAFSERPTVTVTSPRSGVFWTQPVAVTGVLTNGTGWTKPATFTYRIDDGPPIAILPDERWRFTVDPQGLEPGSHVITIRATFREGPPAQASVALIVPLVLDGIDVEAYGDYYHSARVFGTLNVLVVQNPAVWIVLTFAVLLAAVLGFRAWLMLKPRLERRTVEYVPPPE